MKNLALNRVQKMQPYQPPLDSRRSYKGMLLDFNERTIKPDSKVISAVDKAVKTDNLQLYPEYSKLEKSTAEYAGVKPEQIMLANGSDQAIEVIFRTFTEKDSKIVVPAPSFDMYFQNAAVLGSKLVSPLFEENSMAFPTNEVIAAIDDKTKLVIVCHPNSPTGTLISPNDIEAIAKKAENSIVCIDEAYFEFSGETAAGLIEKYPNVMVTRTFSKAFGLASLRVGYVIASEIHINEMKKVRSPYPVNMAACAAASAALEDKSYMEEYVEEVMGRAKPAVEEFFSKNKITFYPSAANFILFNPDNPKKVYEKLLAKGVLLRPQNKPGIEGMLRLTIGTLEQMKRFCEIYEKELLK